MSGFEPGSSGIGTTAKPISLVYSPQRSLPTHTTLCTLSLIYVSIKKLSIQTLNPYFKPVSKPTSLPKLFLPTHSLPQSNPI